MDRRGFLKGMAGILAAGVAPAAIGSGILMPIKKLWTPPTSQFVGIDVATGESTSTLWLSVTVEDGLGRVWRHDFNPPVRANECPQVVFPVEQPVRLHRTLVTWDEKFRVCIGTEADRFAPPAINRLTLSAGDAE